MIHLLRRSYNILKKAGKCGGEPGKHERLSTKPSKSLRRRKGNLE
jgi:hypothetical protein